MRSSAILFWPPPPPTTTPAVFLSRFLLLHHHHFLLSLAPHNPVSSWSFTHAHTRRCQEARTKSRFAGHGNSEQRPDTAYLVERLNAAPAGGDLRRAEKIRLQLSPPRRLPLSALWDNRLTILNKARHVETCLVLFQIHGDIFQLYFTWLSCFTSTTRGSDPVTL